MSMNKNRFYVYLDPVEKEKIAEEATRHGLSISAYLRMLAWVDINKSRKNEEKEGIERNRRRTAPC